jgi:hypothetical protein
VLAAVTAGAAVIIAACGADYYEIPIETPIQPKLDVSAFQRVLVAGFVAGGSEDVDANQETVRLLRSQLRTKSSLKVIDADILPLLEVAQDQAQPAADDSRTTSASGSSGSPGARRPGSRASKKRRISNPTSACSRTPRIGSASARIPEPAHRHGHRVVHESIDRAVQRDQEVFDSLGRRRVMPVRTYMERKGFVLRPKFVFIDGRTGATMLQRATGKRSSTTPSRTRRRCHRISSSWTAWSRVSSARSAVRRFAAPACCCGNGAPTSFR